jgi:signal transduction histidine kinase
MGLSDVPARVFCVEDEIIVARDIRQQLLSLGYAHAGHAVSGETALTHIAEVLPDLVLMDIELSGDMDGITAAHQIRERFDIPVVFISAFAADDVLQRAKLAEPYGYILKPFSERDLRTVLEMALYKSRTDRAIHQHAQNIQRMARKVIEAQEAERRRLALELHDDLGQTLTSIKINLATRKLMDPKKAETLDEKTMGIIDDAIERVREMALALRPGMLDVLGLAAAVQAMVDQRFAASAQDYDFQCNLGMERLPSDMEIVVFRIAQEAITNIQRHAQASFVRIALDREGDTVVLRIEDNGRGFDPGVPGAAARASQGIGVMGMRERAAGVGAGFEMVAQPGKGCSITLVCPVEAPGQAPAMPSEAPTPPS